MKTLSDSKITMIGLYKLKSYENSDLFELMNLPEGIDKDTVVANILEKSSEFEVMYPDAEYVHDSLLFWSKKWFWTFDKWIKAINIKYEPLNNYDRTEEWTDNNTHSDDDTIKNTGSSTDHASGTENRTDTANATDNATGSTSFHDDASNELTKSAFDSSSYSPYEKTTSSEDSLTQVTNNSNTQSSGTTAVTSSSDASGTTSSDETRNNVGQFENIHKGRMYGNIGVTTSQQMLQAELDVSMFNLYDRIADIFIQEYCIPVYI